MPRTKHGEKKKKKQTEKINQEGNISALRFRLGHREEKRTRNLRGGVRNTGKTEKDFSTAGGGGTAGIQGAPLPSLRVSSRGKVGSFKNAKKNRGRGKGVSFGRETQSTLFPVCWSYNKKNQNRRRVRKEGIKGGLNH